MSTRQDCTKEILRTLFTYVFSGLSTGTTRAFTEQAVDGIDTHPIGIFSAFVETSIVFLIFCFMHWYSPYLNEKELFTFAHRKHHKGCLAGFGLFSAIGTYGIGMSTYHLLKENHYDHESFTGADIASAIFQTTLILVFLTINYYVYHYFCTERQPTAEDVENMTLDFSTTGEIDETTRLTHFAVKGNGTFN